MSRRKSIFYALFASYVLVLLLPVVLGLSIHWNARSMLMDEYERASEDTQQLAGRLIDFYLDNASNVQYQLVNNDTLSIFLSRSEPYTGYDRYMLVELQNQLRGMVNASVLDENSLYIYFIRMAAGLSSTTINEQSLLYSRFHGNLAMAPEAFFPLLEQFHNGSVITLPNRQGDGLVVLMLSSVPYNNIYTSKATVVQILNGELFTQLLSDTAMAEGMSIYLLDAAGECISASADTLPATEEMAGLDWNTTARQTVTIDGSRYLATVRQSTVQGWRYLTLVSIDTITQRARPLSVSAMLITVINLIMGGIMAYLLTVWQYRPVARLMQHVSPQIQQRRGENEYAQILSAFNTIEQSRREIDILWQQQTYTLQQEFLHSLLLGRVTGSDAMGAIAKALDIDLDDRAFSVLRFSVYDRGETQETEGIPPDVLSESERRIRAQEAEPYTVTVDGRPTLLILYTDPPQAQYEAVCGALLSLLVDLSSGQHAKLLVGMSGLSTMPRSPHDCYLEAGAAIDYKQECLRRQLPLPQALHHTGEIQPLDLNDRPYEPLLRAIRAGHEEQARGLLKAVIASRDGRATPVARLLEGQLFVQLIQQLPPGAYQQEAVKEQLERIAYRIQSDHSTATALAAYTEMLSLVFACRTDASTEETLSNSILQCVHAHYQEADFNVSKTAQLLQMNVSYISQHFREHTGIGLLEYINRVRVNHAKELIHESRANSKVTAIAQQVGFDNLNSFIRVFKRYEGMTPGEYQSAATQREAMRKNSDNPKN